MAPALFIQYAGLVLAALTFFGVLHVLFLSQLVTGIAFAVLLVMGTRRILDEREERPL
jgi:membrane protein implicated in regulation of membrane protease activity